MNCKAPEALDRRYKKNIIIIIIKSRSTEVLGMVTENLRGTAVSRTSQTGNQ
jgi:hypothetical protein